MKSWTSRREKEEETEDKRLEEEKEKRKERLEENILLMYGMESLGTLVTWEKKAKCISRTKSKNGGEWWLWIRSPEHASILEEGT